MKGLTYLATMVLLLGCMAALDRRWGLFFWTDPRRAGTVMAAGFAFFLLWDVAALEAGLYERGASAYMTGVEVAPQLPLEELFFIAFLCYVTMVVHGLVGRVLRGDGSRS